MPRQKASSKKEKYISLAVLIYKNSIALLHRDETFLKTKLFLSVSDDGLSFAKRHDINLKLANGRSESIKGCTGFRMATFGDTAYLTYIRLVRGRRVVVVAKSTDMVDFTVVGEADDIRGPLSLLSLYKFRNRFAGYYGQDRIYATDTEDFETWQLSEPLLSVRKGHFDSNHLHIIGGVTTDKGIVIFYGVEEERRGKAMVKVGAAIFSLMNPRQLLWRSDQPLWEIDVDKADYPLRSLGAIIFGNKIHLYWSSKRHEIFLSTIPTSFFTLENVAPSGPTSLKRSGANPILTARPDNDWENVSTFNPAALYIDDKVHLMYRAVGESGISVVGYAGSKNGVDIDERLNQPAYAMELPKKKDKKKIKKFSTIYPSGGSWGGCEDPRLTRIGDRIYMTYVACDGWSPQGMAVTSISVQDFLNKHWDWTEPVLMSQPGELTKNWVLFPEKIGGKYAILHSTSPSVLVDYVDSLDSDLKIKSRAPGGTNLKRWDNLMRGAGSPPIRTKYGWLVLYHAMDRRDPNRYKVGAMILDINDPTKILYRSNRPILEPVEIYENMGFKSGVVYACGAIVKDGELMVYYGGADSVVCVATANLEEFLQAIINSKDESEFAFQKVSTSER